MEEGEEDKQREVHEEDKYDVEKGEEEDEVHDED